MDSRLILDEAKYRLFIKENTGWQNTIKAQVDEIPGWEDMLDQAINNTNNIVDGVRVTTADSDVLLYRQMMQQQQAMEKLEGEIDQQQQRLETNCESKKFFDIDAFCAQDILRDRIKAIEKAYIDLKCSFMNRLAMIS
ncbi:MAG: hypothetical protein JST86_21165 [Bacteroidetes bacterium]|nr:hypothetical protein [Bacteroidota bacterium]